MATVKRFEDLEIWKRSRKLNIDLVPVYQELNNKRLFDLRSQMLASVGSVMDNIAEGFERGGNREFLQFLSVSKGSLGEVRSQLYRCADLDIISQQVFEQRNEDCLVIAGMISKFMAYIKSSQIRGFKYKEIEVQG